MAQSKQIIDHQYGEAQQPIYQEDQFLYDSHFFDEQLKHLLRGKSIKLANFEYAVSNGLTIASNGTTCQGELFISNSYDFLWTNLEIHAYSNAGNLFGLTHSALPPDRFLLQIKRVDGDDFFSEAIDIARFNPMRMFNSVANITPTLIPGNTQLRLTIQHSRAVADSAFRESTVGDDITGFPVRFQAIFTGARIVPTNKRR